MISSSMKRLVKVVLIALSLLYSGAIVGVEADVPRDEVAADVLFVIANVALADALVMYRKEEEEEEGVG